MEPVFEMIDVGGLRFQTRRGSWDGWVVNEVAYQGTYYSPLEIDSDDVVLDIGMNIGCFSVMAGALGCRVVGYEPDGENYLLSLRNIELNKLKSRITPHNKAVLGYAGTVTLYKHPRNNGCHTTLASTAEYVDSEVVEAVNIKDVLAGGGFTKVKMDCEGAEHEILMAVDDWGTVRIIRFEWHLSHLTNPQFVEVLNKLKRQGFRTTVSGNPASLTKMVTAKKLK